MPLGPLRFRPRLRPLVWGGRRLETLLGRPLPPDEAVAESWELADLPEWVSVVRGGPLDGTPLDSLLRDRREEVLGRTALDDAGRFPLLVKLLDAHRMLSVQVHPDARAARAHPGARPKTEAWFVLHADPGAQLLIGLRPGVRSKDVRRALAEERLPELLVPHTPRPGDVFLIEAGAVHGLGAGVVLAEIQQPSDTTFRLFDWGRGRTLHVEEALDAIRWDLRPTAHPEGQTIRCDAFEARWVRGGGHEPAAPRARVVTATSVGTLRPEHGPPSELGPGDTVLLPASAPAVDIDGADYVRVGPP